MPNPHEIERHRAMQRPARWLLALELRALAEQGSILPVWPWLLQRTPRGDEHPVLVVPGLLAGDGTSALLRGFLRSRGYRAHGWHQGRNLGPRPGVLPALQQRLADLHAESGRKVSLIGWSLGGIFAREIARRAPGQVRQVITLGSPLYGDAGDHTHAGRVYQRLNPVPHDGGYGRGDGAPPVPTTSIYSRSDGIVGWGCCLERPGAHSENVEVRHASHTGMGMNPAVWYVIGDRLAQPEGSWRPFAPSTPQRIVYRVAHG
jgi:dienelactone hydrolase